MKTSEQINELAAALSKAQGAFTNPPRNRTVKVAMKTGGSYTFQYTTLDCIIEMIRPALAANGLSFSQSVTLDADWAIVTTRILHSSGQWIEDVLPVKPDGFGPQQVGSAITYGKRYSLAALLGVASDEDDDGNLGSGHTSEEIRKSPPPKSKAQQVAAEHGMTTGDKLQPPSEKTVYQKAIDAITKAVQARDMGQLKKLTALVDARQAEGVLSESDYKALINEVAVAERKIKAVQTQPEEAAA